MHFVVSSTFDPIAWLLQANGSLSHEEVQKAVSPRGKGGPSPSSSPKAVQVKASGSPRSRAGGSPRAAAASAAKEELQRQLTGLQKQLDTALQDLSKQRTSSSSSEQVRSQTLQYFGSA